MVLIQSHLILPTYKEQFFMKQGDTVKKISKAKYLELYDKSWRDTTIKVLPSITKYLNI